MLSVGVSDRNILDSPADTVRRDVEWDSQIQSRDHDVNRCR